MIPIGISLKHASFGVFLWTFHEQGRLLYSVNRDCKAFDIMDFSIETVNGISEAANFCAKSAPVNYGRYSSTFVDRRVICQLGFCGTAYSGICGGKVWKPSGASSASHDCGIVVSVLAYLSKSKNKNVVRESLSLDFLEPQPSAPRPPPRLAINKARPALSSLSPLPLILLTIHSSDILSVQDIFPCFTFLQA